MRSVIIISIIVLSVVNVYSQDKEQLIKDIRVKFKELNDYTKYKVIKFDNEEFMEYMTDGGGELKAYIKNDTICKVYEFIGLSFGVRKVEYYYWKEELFFAFQTEEVFNHIFHVADTVEIEMSTDEAYELIKTCEKRYYFHNDTIVDVLIKGEEFGGYDTTDEDIEATLESSKKYINFVKAKM